MLSKASSMIKKYAAKIAIIKAATFFVSGLIGYIKGAYDEKRKQTKERLDAANDRAKSDDAIAKLPDDTIRKRLRKWASLRGMGTDKAND